ncbi:MAG: S9 family peptidase [Lysobacterales bacterium 66-474]|nr:MAG: prolyl oligopeptidase [Rhodanobacter sp. SCN 66-43]OJY85883.1 MAG: S9 family peptidase [Xanthomonadales bacterium 66-474]
MKTLLRGMLCLLACAVVTVALAEPVSFTDLARHARYKMVKISPDGSHIAATSVLANGQTVLTIVNLGTHKILNLAPRDNNDVLDFWWASPDSVVYGLAIHQGGWDAPLALDGLFCVKANGSSCSGSGSGNFLARIEGKQGQILVTVTNPDASGSAGALSEVDRVNVSNGSMVTVARAPMREADYLADHHGHVRFAMGDDLDGYRLIYMREPDGGKWELLGQASADRDWPIAFSADDKTVWFTCQGKPSGFGVCRFDPGTRKMTLAWSNPHVEATAIAQGLAENSIIGVEFTDGRPAVSVFDTHAPGVKALIDLMQQYPGEDVQFVSGTDDGSKAIALVGADVDPGTFFLYDSATSKFTPLLQRAGWINPDQLGRAEPFTFKTRDGLAEQGYITYPPGKDGAKGLPMVVYVHGGPYGIRDTWEYDPYVQAMATRGYAVLQVNYRGSGGYGFDFEKAGWLQWGGKMQDDVTDATRWAIAQGIADKDRICIYGGSYGGYAALEGAVSVPDLYKCAIGYVGVYDLRLMFTRGDIPQNLYGKDYLKRVLGTDMDELAQRSPIYQLNNLKARVMLVVGGRDTRVPPVQGMDMHIALLKKKIAHEWLYKPDEWHGFYDEKNIAELFEKVDAFLSASIGPGTGTVAVEASQANTH